MNDGSSGIFDPVQWSIKTEKNSSGEYSVIFISTIEKGWHIYSQHLERNDGPIPTVFQFRPNEKIELNGTVKEGNPLKSYDPNFMMTLNYYEGVANFTQKLRVKEEPVTLEASVTFMVCHEEHGCLPDKTLHYRIHLPSGLVSPFDPETESNTLEVKSGFRYFLPTVNTDAPLVTDCGLVSGEPEKNSSLWQLFVLGFLGGLFALLTPCVFPMIPLTVSFFTKGSQTRKQGLTRASVYGLFIFLIYVLLSLPFFVFDQIDENILNNISTNVPLNVFFFVIFVVFAISFFGYFEITLPASLANKMDSASNTGGMIGSFFMALTLAIVSFSCTGPILGSLLAGSLSKGGAIQLTAGMGGFGLALGIPFALFAAFPGMLKSLPKSGGWLNSVKVVLGFIELALALKFLSQADLVDHWGVLKYELFMGLWIAIFALTALYIFGIIRFPHDSKIKKFSPFRIGFGIIVTTLTLYLASGFRYDEKHNTYKSLSLLSGLAPPVGYSWVYPKDCPHNLDCEHDYDLALERSKRENKPLFVDFTGYACVNCRKMEEHIWIEPDVLEILSRDFIVVSLYVDDKKELPEELQEKYTSMRTGATKNIRTYGDKWAAFQIETFNRNSQPLYCILTPDEKLVNKPAGFTSDKDEYKQWLVCGRDAAKQEMTQTASSR
ncbi:MAG: thioredoxin family protein [Crocinitomicaceae bacterium]|nr:thioredoxin family protein [Crocinitomicaceae bacterium]